jgi:hypothetical protein
MGISWASNLLGKINTFFSNLAAKIGEFLGKTITKVVSPLVRNISSLGSKFNPSVFSKLLVKSEQDLAKMLGTTITKSEIVAVEKYAKEYLKEKPTEEALRQIDKVFDALLLSLRVSKEYVDAQGTRRLKVDKVSKSKRRQDDSSFRPALERDVVYDRY